MKTEICGRIIVLFDKASPIYKFLLIKVPRMSKNMLVSMFILVAGAGLVGCAPLGAGPGSPDMLPMRGGGAKFEVHEYALVEASTDNPDHIGFQNRAMAAVKEQHPVWVFSSTQDATLGPNQALEPFGYQLVGNPRPPFSAFALYHRGKLIQDNIARFSPVSITNTGGRGGAGDFTFTFETLDGDRLVASTNGIIHYQEQTRSADTNYRDITDGGKVVYVHLVSGDTSVPQAYTIGEIPTGAFGLRTIAGEAFYFYPSGDLIRMNYAGEDLHYVYDQVVYNQAGELAVFNPGSTGSVGWFYALRDGLWYYVEIGKFR